MGERRDQVIYVGHATLLLELGGVRVLTDPVLRDRVTFLRRQVPPPDYARLAGIDLVAVSHDHYDHLDLHSLRQVAGGAEVVAPLGCARTLRRAGIESVVEMEPGDAAEVAGVRVHATPAAHHGSRHPLARSTPALGYVFAGGSARVYFAGDTDLFDEMRDLRGKVDAALLPVAGWGPKVGSGHLDAERAATAAQIIEPRIAIPIHWGTYAPPLYRIPDLSAPPREFAALVAERTPDIEVAVLQPGESTLLS